MPLRIKLRDSGRIKDFKLSENKSSKRLHAIRNEIVRRGNTRSAARDIYRRLLVLKLFRSKAASATQKRLEHNRVARDIIRVFGFRAPKHQQFKRAMEDEQKMKKRF